MDLNLYHRHALPGEYLHKTMISIYFPVAVKKIRMYNININ
jgi:hypothetical protein